MNPFEKNYYVWAKGNVHSEIKSNFALVRSLQTSAGNRFLGTLLTLPQSKIETTWKAILKRFHPDGSSAMGEAISAFDQAEIRKYDELLALSFAAVEPGLESRDLVSKRTFQNEASAALKLITKVDPQFEGGKLLRFVTSHRNCVLHTFLDIGSTKYQLCYWHNAFTNDGRLLREKCSVLESLGIASQTYWNAVTEESVQSVVMSLTHAANQFFLFCDSEWAD